MTDQPSSKPLSRTFLLICKNQIKGVTDNLLEHHLGCGVFQILAVTAIYWLPMIPIYSSMQMMSFGSYNPGWICLDNGSYYTHNGNSSENGFEIHFGEDYNVTISSSNFTQTSINQTSKNSDSGDWCALYKQCQHVEFSMAASTVVTEWRLLCDKAYIPQLIISIQMAGIFFGAIFSGTLIDMVGRKKTFYGTLFLTGLLNAVCIFSPSWEIFTILRFLIGVCTAFSISVNFVYSSEFVTRKWRSPLSGTPVWSVSGIIYGVLTMLLKDWQHFLVLISGLSFICCLPVFWIPESLRWLEVKNKSEQYRNAVAKVAKMNRKRVPRIDSKDFVTAQIIEVEPDITDKETSILKSPVQSDTKMKKYTIVDIFRPGYKVYSITVAILWFSTNVIIMSIAFGIKALGGNFYVNLILMNAMSVPLTLFPILAPNRIGRKWAIIICYSVITLCLSTMMFLELFLPAGNGKNIVTLLLVMGVVAGIESGRAVLILMITEIYPTVVRGLGVSWGSLVARIGGIIAPFLIPQDSNSDVYIWYLIMAVLGFINCCLVVCLPETKGKPLKETFDDDIEKNSGHEKSAYSDIKDTD